MRAVEKGISEELLPVFRSKAVAAALLTCAFARIRLRAEQRSARAAADADHARGQCRARCRASARPARAATAFPAISTRSPAYHVPKLGGQNADYIEVALQGYRRGTRGHDTMQAQASSLTDQDIADVAAFFATFEGEAESGRTTRVGGRDRSRAHEGRDLRRLSRARRRRGRAAMAESRGPARDATCSRRSTSTRTAAVSTWS